MIGIILTGHGNFASGLSSSLSLIAGIPENYRSVDFLPEDSVDILTDKIKSAIKELDNCEEILILTDLVGGSPYNVSVKLRLDGNLEKIQVISGVNLGCLIETSIAVGSAENVKELASISLKSIKDQAMIFYTDEEIEENKNKNKKTVKVSKQKNNNNLDLPEGKIVHARIDERLIHGQVAMVWTNTVGASRIVVVNDNALKDEMVLSGLKMAKPAGVKVSVLTVKRAIKRLKENAYAGDKIFVITKNISDMAELIRQGVAIEGVNVGNVAKREGSRSIKKSVNLTEQDIKDINEMISLGHKVTAQMIPNESEQSILNYL